MSNTTDNVSKETSKQVLVKHQIWGETWRVFMLLVTISVTACCCYSVGETNAGHNPRFILSTLGFSLDVCAIKAKLGQANEDI